MVPARPPQESEMPQTLSLRQPPHPQDIPYTLRIGVNRIQKIHYSKVMEFDTPCAGEATGLLLADY